MGGDTGLERLFLNQSRMGERVPGLPDHAIPEGYLLYVLPVRTLDKDFI